MDSRVRDCVDRRLKRFFSEQEIKTAREMGWSELTNGQLFQAAASSGFDVVLTVDRKLKHEQNLTELPVAVVIIASGDTRLSALLPFVSAIKRIFSYLPPALVSKLHTLNALRREDVNDACL